MVIVRVLDPVLKKRYGETMSVQEEIVDVGERKGLWVRPLNGSVKVETAEMTSGCGANRYDTKGTVVPFNPGDND